MGGRIDHTLSNLNTLLTHQHLRIVLLGDGSTARLLPAGSCSVQPAPVMRVHQPEPSPATLMCSVPCFPATVI
jgi:thiamine pyrophosphokinase